MDLPQNLKITHPQNYFWIKRSKFVKNSPQTDFWYIFEDILLKKKSRHPRINASTTQPGAAHGNSVSEKPLFMEGN